MSCSSIGILCSRREKGRGGKGNMRRGRKRGRGRERVDEG